MLDVEAADPFGEMARDELAAECRALLAIVDEQSINLQNIAETEGKAIYSLRMCHVMAVSATASTIAMRTAILKAIEEISLGRFEEALARLKSATSEVPPAIPPLPEDL